MIAYDTNILIYALEGNNPWAAAAEAIVRQGESEGAVLSVLVWQELITGAVLNTNGQEIKLAKALRHLAGTKFIPVSQSICERAVSLTQRHGKQVYGYDAIHLATALEYKATAFVTNDRALLNMQIEGLDIQRL